MYPTCAGCGKPCIPNGLAAGYGVKDGKEYCYECCGKQDDEELYNLKDGDKMALYLVDDDDDEYVTNWPGTLRIRIDRYRLINRSCGTKKDVWFTHRGHQYHGVNDSEDSELCIVQRVGVTEEK